ncbi:paladin [Lepeophtheirus salmonis]|nr:paladin-like [Lepeophtheirus salmonis]
MAAATSTEAFMLELVKEGCEWIKSDAYYKKKKQEEDELKKNNPMKNTVLKFDQFENIHRLPKNVLAFEGAPNFRQVPGYLVFGCGQPTKSGFKDLLEYLLKEASLKKIIWTNMRQEPVVYMNGHPFTPRHQDRLNENMEFPNSSGEYIESLQTSLVDETRKAIQETIDDRFVPEEDKGKVTYFRDTYAEHPDDRLNIKHIVALEDPKTSLVTLSGMYDQLTELGYPLSYVRLPIVDEKAPLEKDFELFLDTFKNIDKDSGCVFNCQMGKGRTTTGMVLACLFKDIYCGDKSRVYYDPSHEVNPDDYADEEEVLEEKANRGQYKVVYDLFKYLPEAREGKAHLDKLIDLCGTPAEGGTGLQNLRECIQWSQTKFDFEPKIKKPFWKQMGKNFIERYCYLILFTTYVKLYESRDFDTSFSLWLDIRAELREVVYNGMINFEWI